MEFLGRKYFAVVESCFEKDPKNFLYFSKRALFRIVTALSRGHDSNSRSVIHLSRPNQYHKFRL